MRRKAAENEAFDFSRSLQKLTPERFYRFIREYPPSDGTSVYIYRLQPVINRRQAGIETSYIEVTSAPVDEDYLLRTHGSGSYHLKLSDSNKPKGLTEVAKTTVEIWDPHVDPSINPAELVVSAPANDKWLQKYLGMGWIVEDGKLKQPASAASEAGVLAKTVSEMAERLSKPAANDSGNEVVKRALDVLTQPRADDGLDRAFQIAERLRPQADPVQAELVKTLAQLVIGRREEAAPAVNPIVQLKETAALLKEFGWGAREASAAGSSWVDAVAALPGILQYGAQFLAQLVSLRAMGNVIEMPPARAAAAVPPAPAGPAGSQPAGEGEMLNPMDLQALIEVGRDAIDAFERGIDGEDFAHGLICRRGGEQLYDKLRGMGKQGVLSALAMVPGLAQQLAPRQAALEAWLEEFMSYGQEPEEPEQGAKVA